MRKTWADIAIPETGIAQGDMPGDQIQIGGTHIQKAGLLMPMLLEKLPPIFEKTSHERAVISVYGGSGVGKSEIASLITYYLGHEGIGSYTLSGDNYPLRIPKDNDAERLRVFQRGGMRGLLASGQYTDDRGQQLRQWQEDGQDAEPALCRDADWLSTYQEQGRMALKAYLGTPNEIDFSEVSQIISAFKNGAERIMLKRMGRAVTDLWYDSVDFSGVKVLVIEWTHGNSDYLQGVDYRIFLNSTPQETLVHRMSRQRDGNADGAFTTMVLGIEQKLLDTQSGRADVIVSKNGGMLSRQEYRALMLREGAGQ
ncbi:MAG: adenylylsulfate kinase [Clostridiales bacterium]|nr:adenylylsulfate kinase [Clostridiales bacterium]